MVGCDKGITVDFIADNELYLSMEFDGASAIELPKAPTKEGYKFMGWFTDSEFTTEFDSATVVDKNTTLYAKMLEDRTFNIKFVDKYGKTLRSAKVENGIMPIIPQVEDIVTDEAIYKFKGWDKSVTVASADTVYVAQYTSSVASYTVTYEPNGGASADGKYTQTADYGTKLALDLVVVKEGFVFSGWCLDNTIVTEIEVTDNVILEAMWTELYTITFLGRLDVVLKVEEVKAGTMPNIPDVQDIKTDSCTYNFICWDTEVSVATKDTTYTAQFYTIANYYTLSYDCNGGAFETPIADTKYVYGTEITLESGIEREGYSFTGWLWQNEIVSTVSLTQNITVVAQWTRVYPITFVYMDSEYSQNITEILSVVEGDMPTAPTVADSITESSIYKFVGWNTAVSVATEATTYTAEYEQTPRTYTITYDANGGQFGIGEQQKNVPVAYGSTVVFRTEAPNPTYTGRKLLGWSKSATSKEITNSEAITADITLYAVWEKTGEKTYPIRFFDNIGDIVASLTVKEGETPTPPVMPETIVENGETLTFMGWDKEVIPAYETYSYTAVYQ